MKKVVLIVMLMLIQQIFAQNDNENQTDKDNNKRAISYQSQIKNSEGQSIEDGKYKVVFNLYDTEKGEKPVWFETQILEIKDGILNALIGSKKRLRAEDFKDQLWLTIEINDEESEKQFISASSYSLFTSRIDRDAFVAGEGIILAQRPDGRLEIAVKEIYPINGETINTFHVNHLDMKYSENNFDYFHIRNKSATPVGTVMYNKKSAWYGGNLESDGNYDDFVIYARDGRDLVLKSDQNNGSVFVGGETCPNNLFITGGLTVQGTTKITNRDFMTGGTNNWQFSTPDDGRQDMFIINRMHSSASDWSKQAIFHENGDMTINGNIIGKKDINLTGTLNATNVNSKINASLFKLADSTDPYDILKFTNRDNIDVGSIMYNRTSAWYGGKKVGELYDDFVIYARSGRDLVLKCDADPNGNFGEVYIGSAGHKNNLRVNGTIFATEIQVKLDVFPDYVFKKDYNLLSLSEVENHINSHGTLPGMPTEKEIVENGLNINQMQIKLVEKIEELTLHMIRLEKENSDLRARMDSINR